MTLAECVQYLKDCCKSPTGLVPRSYSGYYCGITNDLVRRDVEHNAKRLGAINCHSFEVAKQLEELMHNEGFDTGKQLGNGKENSVYVYVYKKIPGVTNESLQ